MQNLLKTSLVTRAICCLAPLTGLALMLAGNSALAQWKIEVAPEYFYWKEQVSDREKIMDESGLRYGLELSYKQEKDAGWLYAARLKAYYGSVDQTWNGYSVKTTADYYGGFGELLYGYRWAPARDQYVDAMAGVGVEDWMRRSSGTNGYCENWLPIYIKAGLESRPEETGWTEAVGIKVPVYTVETVDFQQAGLPDVTLHPGTMVSGYAELGYIFNSNFSVVAFFDSYWFTKSSSAGTKTVQVYQPESKSYEAGVKLGWIF